MYVLPSDRSWKQVPLTAFGQFWGNFIACIGVERVRMTPIEKGLSQVLSDSGIVHFIDH